MTKITDINTVDQTPTDNYAIIIERKINPSSKNLNFYFKKNMEIRLPLNFKKK